MVQTDTQPAAEPTSHDYARTILVPIANPKTAPALIELGLSLVHPDEGRVLPLIVMVGDPTDEAESIEKLKPVCEKFTDVGHKVELVTRVANSVIRGILDCASEEGADLLILGVHWQGHGEFTLGVIAENVAAAAHCDVLIYRPGTTIQFKHIIVPTDGSPESKVANEIGLLMSNFYRVDVEALYISDGAHDSYWMGLGRILQAVDEIPGHERIKHNIVSAQSPVAGVLARADADDLLVIGESQRNSLERWLYGDFSRALLNRSKSSVVLVARDVKNDGWFGQLQQSLGRFSLRLTPVEEDEIAWQAQGMANLTVDYIVLIIISAALASLGLIVNSTAVIIGAMLVAPLMSPLIGLAVGLATVRLNMIRRGLVTLVIGVLLALLVALVIGAIVPIPFPTTEMLARGNPSPADVAVALASGVIGAYATARKDIPSALAGVAIAAALMPPLVTLGLDFPNGGSFGIGARAGLLFLTNIIGITLAAWGIFLWLGLRPSGKFNAIQRWGMLVATVLLAALTINVLFNVSTRANDRLLIQERISERFAEAELVSTDVVSVSPIRVIATLRTPRYISHHAVSDLEESLNEELGRSVEIEIVTLRVVRP